jgi:hypothetical protein
MACDGHRDEPLDNNRRYAIGFEPRHLDVAPSHRLAIVTCIGLRLDVRRSRPRLGHGQAEACVTPGAW